jgi:IS5 family transposase
VPLRHLLEEHDLGRQLFDEVQRHLAAKGLQVATGTIVDATIINAPSSTKNAKKARDPDTGNRELAVVGFHSPVALGHVPQYVAERGDPKDSE